MTVGDLAVPAGILPASGIVTGDDVAFTDALRALGLDGWPAAEVPRLSRLWVADAIDDGLFAGLMIESPEPLERAGRLRAALTIQRLYAGHVRDRSEGRLCWNEASGKEPSVLVSKEGLPKSTSPAEIEVRRRRPLLKPRVCGL